MLGTKGKDGAPGKEGVDVIQLSGLGGAISTCVGAVGRLASSGVAQVVKIETGYPTLKQGETSDDLDETSRGIALVKVTLKVIPESRNRKHEEEEQHATAA